MLKLYRSFADVRRALQESKVSVVALLQHYLHQVALHNKQLNAFLQTYDQEALAQAEAVDRKIALGKAGRLAGMVLGLKDVICYRDHPLQAASRILEGFRSQFSATVVERLLAEDAIIIGRQNCDEFAMGSSSENSAFGPVRNALDTSRVPGGSSGGSAVAVQAGMCLASLGTDTGGSVRQPAAFCGLVGLKPTYGRLSRHGLLAYASSFDCIGTLTHTVEDAALLLEIMAGPDEFDSTASRQPVPSYSALIGQKPTHTKVAYLRPTLESQGVSVAVKEAILRVIELLKAEGFTVEAVEFPLLEYILPTYYILTTAEASTNLARYDGVRYGYRSAGATDVESMYKLTRSEGFGKEVQRRILLGTFVLSASYYDAYFTKAQRVRRLIMEQTRALFSYYDFILSPTSPTTAFKIGELANDPLQMYLADIFSVQANVAGIPAISIPCGKDSQGLPIGLQIMADWFEETKMLTLARFLMEKLRT
ncbi:MAG: Asp-tRNA(Asn)/Glu-tRNA(Gln) amidotransferase subunit GatA [Cytophagales bacterium]|nr:Asp-tRNA(Asn)/Glu-tRNA(Gln) amidotransferase subunit GatA [Bernardetiaceae bacterium]MDW8210351.1 Asp-tRNA(Asn)/Glu-tRNA(Gln) amidotransferase subunit GatA [Cytophagales bacterium]